MSGGIATRLPAGAVLLTGDAIIAAADAVRVAQRWRRGQGLGPSVAWDRLLGILDLMTDHGPADTEPEPVAQDDVVDIPTAAALLGCSPRQARRLASTLGGRKLSGVWYLDRIAVAEHVGGTH